MRQLAVFRFKQPENRWLYSANLVSTV